MREYNQNISGAIQPKGAKQEPKEGVTSYRLTTALLDSVIGKKESTLFSEQEHLPEGMIASYEPLTFKDEKGKTTTPTALQMKAYLVLSEFVDSMREEEKVKEYINNLPERMKWDNEEEKRKRAAPLQGVINVREFARQVAGTPKVGTKHIEITERLLKELEETYISQEVKLQNGDRLTLDTPIVKLGRRVKKRAKNGKETDNWREILVFGDVFFFGLDMAGGYQIAPTTILQLWNTAGNNTELFGVVFFLLLRMRGNFVSHAQEKAAQARKELLKEKRDIEEVDKREKAALREALTYRESVASLLERVSNRETFYKKVNNKEYLRKDKVKSYLEDMKNSLLAVGIVSEVYFSQEGMMCNFVFNPDWIAEERQKLKQ